VKRIRFKLLFASLMLSICAAHADVSQEQAAEVEHLLAYVEGSGCTFIRNGDQHATADSVSHIMKKYDYYRDDIKTTEDFISYSATKSVLSGKYYTVNCPGSETQRTQDWLLAELERYRTEK
jgi:hypothetical protein